MDRMTAKATAERMKVTADRMDRITADGQDDGEGDGGEDEGHGRQDGQDNGGWTG